MGQEEETKIKNKILVAHAFLAVRILHFPI